jgi:LAS superfamily LD-carboxypeptidase LdcB
VKLRHFSAFLLITSLLLNAAACTEVPSLTDDPGGGSAVNAVAVEPAETAFVPDLTEPPESETEQVQTKETAETVGETPVSPAQPTAEDPFPAVSTTTTLPATTAPVTTTTWGPIIPTVALTNTYSDLSLVNKEYPLPVNFVENLWLRPVQGSYRMDYRCADYAVQMIYDAYKDGVYLLVVSAYRSVQRQQMNFESYTQRMRDSGLTAEQAIAYTSTVIAPPGASEHNAGLALDILTVDWWNTHDDITSDFDQTAAYDWLVAHCAEYGFILRYLNTKEDITGYVYEPWHYRFVGVEYAKEIMDSGLCLEEWLAARDKAEQDNPEMPVQLPVESETANSEATETSEVTEISETSKSKPDVIPEETATDTTSANETGESDIIIDIPTEAEESETETESDENSDSDESMDDFEELEEIG